MRPSKFLTCSHRAATSLYLGHQWRAFYESLPGPVGRLAGVDFGTRYVGVAISDRGRRLAFPHTIITRSEGSKDVRKLAEVLRREDICGLIWGLPLSIGGSWRDPTCNLAVRYFEKLAETKLVQMPVLLWDERYSTSEIVQRLRSDAPQWIKSRRKASRIRPKEILDKGAATVILQDALDTFRSTNTPSLHHDPSGG
uniref:YqgF/RNase H-like domain-containing protein n=1 Tax=Compsopogon caeruleus TaxID=31354 RepID=A0A7S1TH16_9RHOD|mmetsp:Transcript_7186/g.14770  ORF Transcript_7186/g.14770 Transcript_7186/m.14770 type:complete len:197 (+) Transcript_7186:937-1527(+)